LNAIQGFHGLWDLESRPDLKGLPRLAFFFPFLKLMFYILYTFFLDFCYIIFYSFPSIGLVLGLWLESLISKVNAGWFFSVLDMHHDSYMEEVDSNVYGHSDGPIKRARAKQLQSVLTS
jgi:hypothetical protein